MLHEVFIAAGSNVGNRFAHLARARAALSLLPQVHWISASSIYETEPVGGPAQGCFLNALWQVSTSLDASALLTDLLAIESAVGRIRAEKNGPRAIDLDLIAMGDLVIQKPDLRLPHPRLHERWFVLKPLCDLAPGWQHPILRKTAAQLLTEVETLAGGVLAGHIVQAEPRV